MKHSNYTQNFEVDGPYKSDIRLGLIDYVMIYLAGVTTGVLIVLFSTGN